MRITYVGHATLLIELDGVRLLTDPFLRDRLGPLRRHGPSPDPARIGIVDAALVSHAHPDHFDVRSLHRLAGKPAIIVPAGLGGAVERHGHGHGHAPGGREIREVRVDDSFEIGGLRITAVPARHWGWPIRPRSPSIGYLIEGSVGVYFAGDTSFYPRMERLAGHVDLALLPVGRWGPHPGPERLGPASAARVARVVGARAAIPIHWGTFYPAGLARVLPGPLTEPAPLFARLVRRLAPDVAVHVIEPGASADIEIPGGDRRPGAGSG